MRYYIVLAFLLFAQHLKAAYTDTIPAAPLYAANPMKTGLDSLVDKHVRGYMSNRGTAGISMALVEDKKISYYNYGRTGRPEHPHTDSLTLYEIGSISKTFTANILAQLVLEKKMALDASINQYLPDSIPPLTFEGSPITVVSLSNHSSGMPEAPIDIAFGQYDPTNPFAHYSKLRLMNFLKQYKPFKAVGTSYRYSNLAVGILGNLIENVEQKDFEAVLAYRITRPLAMKHTLITVPQAWKTNFAIGHDNAGIAVKHWDLAAFKAAGAIRSNTLDMVKYVQAQWNNQPGELYQAIALTHKETAALNNTSIGLGWFLIKDKNGDELITHNGKTGGFGTLVYINKTKKKAVIVLTNSTAGSNNGAWLNSIILGFF